MPTPILFVEDEWPDSALICPLCGDTNTHLDDVYVAGRAKEDGPVTQIWVDSGGNLHHEDIPIEWRRRHSIGIGGWCENGRHRFIIEFLQHKGATLTSIRDNGNFYDE